PAGMAKRFFSQSCITALPQKPAQGDEGLAMPPTVPGKFLHDRQSRFRPTHRANQVGLITCYSPNPWIIAQGIVNYRQSPLIVIPGACHGGKIEPNRPGAWR